MINQTPKGYWHCSKPAQLGLESWFFAAGMVLRFLLMLATDRW
jgi:hypothetical protein